MRFRDRTNYLLQRLVLAGVAMAAGTMALASGCDPRFTSVVKRLQDQVGSRNISQKGGAPAQDTDQIRIGSFNLGIYGTTKSRDQATLSILARIVRSFDVLAVQEIRSVRSSVLDELLDAINRSARNDGSSSVYDYVIGPPLGRSNSKEQYAYIFDTTRIWVDLNNVYTLHDPQDLLHREPFVARFSTRPMSHLAPFTFTLVNMHTDPDSASVEINYLDDVLQTVVNDGSGEDDIIVLGDFNLAPDQFGELAQVPGIRCVVQDMKTNTRQTKVYDNICYVDRYTIEYQQGGVLDIEKALDLNQQQALQISDHFPVWADFSVHEGGVGGSIARQSMLRQFR